jgi:hypothetical protein
MSGHHGSLFSRHEEVAFGRLGDLLGVFDALPNLIFILDHLG